MRVAFLTPEHPSEYPDGGGLGTYVDRMSRALLDAGHEPEVFVPSTQLSETVRYHGVTVHRVNWKMDQPVLRLLRVIAENVIWGDNWRYRADIMLQAKRMASALERRHAVAPFQLVQSADYLATGLLVRRRRDRPHVVRCSSAADLYNQADGNCSSLGALRESLERRAIRRADVAYAPSQFVASHFRRAHDIEVRVIRPPVHREGPNLEEPTVPLPSRYFLHFGGYLCERKGTHLLAAALPIAWAKAPDLTMVWSGRVEDEKNLREWRSLWGERGNQVHITGPLVRPQMQAVVARADATVLPSKVDNLPNTVIESLTLGVPVIGSRGASIDELVEEDRTGHLVALGDVHGLAEALAMMWLRASPVSKGFAWRSDLLQEMQPGRAVASLIGLVPSAAFHRHRHECMDDRA